MSRRFWRYLKVILAVVVVALCTLYVAAEWLVNVNSNLVLWAVAGSKQELQVKLKNGEWKNVSAVSLAEVANALVARSEAQGMKWYRLRVRRPAGRLAAMVQKIFGAEVNVVVISPEYHEFSTSFLPEFKGTTSQERLDAEQLLFAVNANFKEPNGKPLGWVWHQGQLMNPAFPTWSGVFFVKEGKPYFGPKSLLDEVPGPISEGAQVYPSVMKNHTVFNYVTAAPDRFFDGVKVTYRSLAGMRQNGEAVFVLSGDGGVMNVNEVTQIAYKLAVQNATLMDGGRALQYSLQTEDGPWHFAAFNNKLDMGLSKVQIQRSPVFLTVKRKPPAIRTQTLSPLPAAVENAVE